MTKLAEIQEAIAALSPQEQAALIKWLMEEESPEMLEASDETNREGQALGFGLTRAADRRKVWHGATAANGVRGRGLSRLEPGQPPGKQLLACGDNAHGQPARSQPQGQRLDAL